jgi:hypothetical protein
MVLLLLRLSLSGSGQHDALPMAGPPAFVRAEPRGYSGGVGVPPDHGVWRGIGTTISSIGYSTTAPGQVIVRVLAVSRICEPRRSCYFWLSRQLAGQSPEGARLSLAADGWHASFPLRSYSCKRISRGKWIYWAQHTTMIFRFAPGGSLEARERDYSWAQGCGYGTAETVWRGTLDEGTATLRSLPAQRARRSPSSTGPMKTQPS